MSAPTRGARPSTGATPFLPTDFRLFTGLQVPDPITFITGSQWLDRKNLYPRQATLIKVIFLREDLFTDFDYQVVGEWEESFRRSGNNGITPNVLERMRYLRERGYRYFREVLLVLGRRAGKGYVSALAMSYVLWGFLAKGDPQGHYGVDRDKRLACYIYAGKKEQARDNLWRDLVNVITGGPCFAEYVSKPMGESLSVYAPNDLVRIRKLEARGIRTTADMATFNIVPKESTVMSGRGPASFMLGFDEMAHVITAGGASRSAEEVYSAATPALDQFRKDAFIIEPSSPWQMIGQFYANWQHCLELDEAGQPAYPEMLMLQLASWQIYESWERAHEIPLFPEGYRGDLGEYEDAQLPRFAPLKGAIQVYDDAMARLEKANPDMFAVERRSHWQATIDAYLDPKKIDAMFGSWRGRDLEMQSGGVLSIFYKGHADPSLANANFGVAIAHPETDEDGVTHAVFDYIHHWQPSDFPDNIIDYVEIEDHLWRIIRDFKPDEFTFDQWNSASSIAQLSKKVKEGRFPKRVSIYEKTATSAHNFERAENFKVALNQGWIHAPEYELAQLELRFLQLKNGKVVKQDTGPVTTKDVSDCHDFETEVLTEHGWKLFRDVQPHERVATRNEYGELEYQLPTNRVTRHYEGPMYLYEGHRTNFCVTPGHRMLVQPRDSKEGLRFVRAEDLGRGQTYQYPKTAHVVGRQPGIIDVDSATHAKPFVTSVPRAEMNWSGRVLWTVAEDEIVRQGYPTMQMDDLLALLPGRNRSSVYNRVKTLKVRRGQIGDRHGDRPKGVPPVSRMLFAKFLGFWLAEGRKYHKGTHRGYGVRVTQTKPQGIEWFDSLLQQMGWDAARRQHPREVSWTIKSYGLREYLKALCLDGHELIIPDEVFMSWTGEEMEALLEGLSWGDGNFSTARQCFTEYNSTSQMLMDDVQRLMAHIGRSGQIRQSGHAGDLITGVPGEHYAKLDRWRINYDQKYLALIKGCKIKEISYRGPVYCLTVPNETLFTRRRGVAMWSGNCLMECVWTILGTQVGAYINGTLSGFGLTGSAPGGFDALQRMTDRPEVMDRLGGIHRHARDGVTGRGAWNPARGSSGFRGRR